METALPHESLCLFRFLLLASALDYGLVPLELTCLLRALLVTTEGSAALHSTVQNTTHILV